MNKIVITILSVLLLSCQTETKQVKKVSVISPQLSIQKVASVAIIEPAKRITDLYTEKSGIVVDIPVKINDAFKKGDVLLQLKGNVEKKQLEQAQSKFNSQLETIEIYQHKINVAEAKLEQSKSDHGRGKKLLIDNALSAESFEDRTFDLSIKELELVKAKAEWDEQKSKLKELTSDIAYYEELLSQTIVTAPFDGQVMTMNLKIGNTVNTSNAIGQFLPKGSYVAIAEIDELYALKVKKGMRAYVRTQGKTDTLQLGKVTALAPGLKKKSLFSDNATNLEDRRVREVHVELDHKDQLLVGSKVECIILLGNESQLLN